MYKLMLLQNTDMAKLEIRTFVLFVDLCYNKCHCIGDIRDFICLCSVIALQTLFNQTETTFQAVPGNTR